MEKLWARAPMVAAAVIVTAVAIAFLYVPSYLTRTLPGPALPATAPRPPSYSADELAVLLYASAPELPAAPMPVAEIPRPAAPAVAGPPPPPEDISPEASEQRVFKTRRALETIDPRELVRNGMGPR